MKDKKEYSYCSVPCGLNNSVFGQNRSKTSDLLGEMAYPKIWSIVDARTEFYSKEVKKTQNQQQLKEDIYSRLIS